MKELLDYDNALASKNLENNTLNMPLLSWDFHMENLYANHKLNKDLASINKLTSKLKLDVNLEKELKESNSTIIITDTNLNIEFASANIQQMSGFLPAEVVGNTPKMFQGPETDKVIAKKIRQHVNKNEPFSEVLINYKKNKTTYKCHIKGYPIFDKKGNLVKYAAVEHAA